MNTLAIGILSVLASAVATYLLIIFSGRINFLARPTPERWHKKATPILSPRARGEPPNQNPGANPVQRRGPGPTAQVGINGSNGAGWERTRSNGAGRD